MNNSNGLKGFAKKNLRGIYDFASVFCHSFDAAKLRRQKERETIATHEASVSSNDTLKIIYVNSGPDRLDIVFKKFSKQVLLEQEIIDFLTSAINFAAEHHFVLRIISRNNQINPRDFLDFIKTHKLAIPEEYSFYTDLSSRLSSPVRRLDISKNDYIFAETEIANLKKWIKNYGK